MARARVLKGDRLQPSLLDRLTDDAPETKSEPRERQLLTAQKLRRAVLRDLSWLLNTDSLQADVDLDDYPEVGGSVLNFGMRDLSGVTAADIDAKGLEKRIRQVIRDFEPRLDRNSVKVRVVMREGTYNKNAVGFEIEALLWGDPAPSELLLRTDVDLESGNVTIEEHSAT